MMNGTAHWYDVEPKGFEGKARARVLETRSPANESVRGASILVTKEHFRHGFRLGSVVVLSYRVITFVGELAPQRFEDP